MYDLRGRLRRYADLLPLTTSRSLSCGSVRQRKTASWRMKADLFQCCTTRCVRGTNATGLLTYGALSGDGSESFGRYRAIGGAGQGRWSMAESTGRRTVETAGWRKSLAREHLRAKGQSIAASRLPLACAPLRVT